MLVRVVWTHALTHCTAVDCSRYLTVLGAVYLRLVGKPLDVYTMLEPMYSDYRKLRKRNVIGAYSCVSAAPARASV